MKRFKLNLTANPTFSTVTGLTNKTFNPDNIVSGRGATEDQLKVVGDNVQTINDYLDEFGCSNCDEQYAGVRATLNALQVAQEECCENRVTPENLNGLIGGLQNHIDDLQTAQEECCNRAVSQENLDALIADLRDKLNALEAQIEECCNKSCFGGGTSEENTCDGNEITVSFQWTNQNHTEGKATATSQDPNKTINSYWFLVGNRSMGIYYKQKVSDAGDYRWSIDDSGNISLTQKPSPSGSTPTQMYCLGIVAVDSGGCEGMISMTLPMYNSVGG